MSNTDIDRVVGWQGRQLVDRDGSRVGTIGDIYLDDATNQPAWVVVNTGLFGTRSTFVPLREAHEVGDQIQVPYEKNLVKDAPNIDEDGQLTPEEEVTLYRHYGMDFGSGSQGFGSDSGVGERTADTGRADTSRDADARDWGDDSGVGKRPTADTRDPSDVAWTDDRSVGERISPAGTVPNPAERVLGDDRGVGERRADTTRSRATDDRAWGDDSGVDERGTDTTRLRGTDDRAWGDDSGVGQRTSDTMPPRDPSERALGDDRGVGERTSGTVPPVDPRLGRAEPETWAERDAGVQRPGTRVSRDPMTGEGLSDAERDAGTRRPAAEDARGMTRDDAATRSAEQPGTHQRGRLRRYIVTERVTQSGPVKRKEIEVEEIGLDDGGTSPDPRAERRPDWER